MRKVDDPKIRRLGEVALFRRCTPKELTRLAGITDQAVLETGQVLCRQGEVATAAFVIDDGDADVKVGEQVIGGVGAGEIVGEMGLRLPGPIGDGRRQFADEGVRDRFPPLRERPRGDADARSQPAPRAHRANPGPDQDQRRRSRRLIRLGQRFGAGGRVVAGADVVGAGGDVVGGTTTNGCSPG